MLLDLGLFVFQRAYSFSLTLIASGHCLPCSPDYTFVVPTRMRICEETFIANTLSQDLDGVKEKEEGERVEGKKEKEGKVGGWGCAAVFFFLSPRALLFQKCLGLHSSTSAPLGLSTAS